MTSVLTIVFPMVPKCLCFEEKNCGWCHGHVTPCQLKEGVRPFMIVWTMLNHNALSKQTDKLLDGQTLCSAEKRDPKQDKLTAVKNITICDLYMSRNLLEEIYQYKSAGINWEVNEY